MCHSLIGMKQSAERQGGALLSSQRPDSARTMGPEGWAAPPILPGLLPQQDIKGCIVLWAGLGPSCAREEAGGGTPGRLSHSSAPLAGIPRGLPAWGGWCTHGWLLLHPRGGQVCPGVQVSFLGARGTPAYRMPDTVVGPLKA